MVRQKLSKFAFYRYRYVLAYFVFVVALGVMLLVAGFYLPGGLTSSEMRSALISDNLNPSQLFALAPDQLVYLPYRLLQAASISIFGVSAISIKLPSIILGFASGLGVLYLLSLWYRRNVAIIASTVAVTTNQFLLSAQAGQPGILYIFLTTMILIATSMIARRSAYAKLWVIVGFILAGVSLYMPLNLYILIALMLTAIIHPHARHLFLKQSSKPILLLGTLIFLGIISPLIAGIINDINLLKTLLGFSESITHFSANAKTLIKSYTSFMHPSSGTTLTPVYGLGVVVLIALGIYRLVSAKYTARSYIISFWLLFLIPLVCLNPSFVSITFIPAILLMALSVDYLIWSWYRLFPRNPYARVFGLLPLGVLMTGLVVSSVDRYVYGLHYDKSVYSAYSYDLGILTNKLHTLDRSTSIVLVVPASERAFYASFARHQRTIDHLSVVTNVGGIKSADLAIVERSMKKNVPTLPTDILVRRTSEDADRFYLYKNS
jgi:hypothetical protein